MHIHIRDRKERTQDNSIGKAPVPDTAYVSLSQHLGKICHPEVKIGDAVLRGQKIATAEAHVFAPVHAPISGKIIGIQDWPHPVLGRSKAIVIEGDGLDKEIEYPKRTPGMIESLTPDEIHTAVLNAGIVGMGGASFPTHIKLNPPKPVDTLIINGAECEPYLTGDYRLMVEKTDEIIKGMQLSARCTGAKNIYVAIEDNKPEAIKIFSGKAGSFTVKVLRSAYPQGGEKQLIKSVLRKEVPQGKLPFDIGVVVQNVATAYCMYEAVYLGKPLYERVVTVTGSCLSRPKNLLARIGTPIKILIEACGPLKEEPGKIIIGGPMMGIAQFSDDVPVIKSTTGVLLLTSKEARLRDEEFCIRCGACVRACPAGLMPCLINLSSEKALWSQAKAYNAMDCIECGLCNYVCPSNRLLTQSIKRAKFEVSKL